jgi:GNAT superfamily N-acetyltransferase
MLPGLTIRHAEEREARLIADLHVRAWQAAYRGLLADDFLDSLSVDEREAMWRRKLSSGAGSQTWVSEDSGRVVGFAAAGPSRDTDASPSVGEVYAIYVEPERVGTGVGRVLFAQAVDHLWKHGYAVATLWVLGTNARARRFYERAGWRSDGATRREWLRGPELKEVRYRTEL